MKFYIFAKCFFIALIIAWVCGFILGGGLILNGLYALIFSASHTLNFNVLVTGIVLLIGAPIVIILCYVSYLNSCFELDIIEDF